jgi:folate-binding protein YgfZ
MAQRYSIPLAQRSLLSIGGDDRRAFLQGLVSNDVTKTSAERALYGAFLTPQGKFLHELFLAEHGDALLLDTETDRRPDFAKRLSIYKLRSKIVISQPDDWIVYSLLGEDAAAAVGLPNEPGAAKPFAGGLVFVDPRLPAAGLRAWLPVGAEPALAEAGFTPAEVSVWDEARIGLGLPDGSRDMPPDKAILLENGFDELNGVDWKKGCYLGQELTARTKYRGLVRKRLLPVEIDGPAPQPGAPILLGEVEAGEMRTHCGGVGLALIRLEQFEQWSRDGGELRVGEALLRPRKPDWATF